MRKSLIIALLFLVFVIINSSELKTYYDNYIRKSDSMKAIDSELMKNKYERKVIISQCYPKFIFNTNFKKYAGVYDLNSIQAKYLNFTFDVDVNFAKNIHVEFTSLQNLYSGEKIYDLKRSNKKGEKILSLKRDKEKFKELREFIKSYEDLLILRNEIEILKTKYELSNIKWLETKARFAKDSPDMSLNEKRLDNLHNIILIRKREYLKKFEDFKERTGVVSLHEPTVLWIYDLFKFNENYPDIKLLKEHISLLYIKKRLNSDNFKPTLDLFFTYGLQDDNMEVLEDGYTTGIVFNWNIFDGFKDKYVNKQIDIDIKNKNDKLQDLIDESEKNFDLLMAKLNILKVYYKNENDIISILQDKLNKKEKDLNKGLIGKKAFLKSKSKYLEEKSISLKYSKEYILSIYNASLLSNNFSGFWKVVR